ncbi:hypothetical protein LEP1GSC005_1639 [Leptospira santarosai str. ST188]|uniref:Uncharacterized protein n=2 Tax=Leptospira santarosai TaxID=28183 RepID=M6UH22_9LEPT|nr:hypothetical protein LEP1GSC163_2927 [Leptospira santarosai str. CBC379]EMF88939.1 hypothetical protein LEP1GSC005_1639 [Leptospira santarosai str. ST188]EMN23019.1 hypothetical protein LEP1GSC063_3369 [Leptospira santarosai serovar Arenal str. MAVJ 401]EMO44422.1 hypothetical protein LEP1GSC187_3882 [Leptospira santarosai str. ZUN179]
MKESPSIYQIPKKSGFVNSNRRVRTFRTVFHLPGNGFEKR